MSDIKVVLLVILTSQEVSAGYTLEQAIRNLRKHAQKNDFTILKVFSAVEDIDMGKSPTFASALSFVESQSDKVLLIHDQYHTYNDQTDSGAKLKELITAQKVEPKVRCHPCFKEPAKPHTRIWRYIDLAKFIDLLQTQSVYFTRADFLRQFDKQEGVSVTRLSKQINKSLADKVLPFPETIGIPLEAYLEMEEQTEKIHEERLLKETYINCWHMADFENFAMWKIYSDTFGVAIESTYEALSDSFMDDDWSFYNESKKIYIGKVIYIDRNTFIMPKDNIFWPYMHKIREFSYENELRCIISNWNASPETLGIKVKINLGDLIKKIHVSPFAPEWFKSSIEDLCRKYSIDSKKVVQSNLA